MHEPGVRGVQPPDHRIQLEQLGVGRVPAQLLSEEAMEPPQVRLVHGQAKLTNDPAQLPDAADLLAFLEARKVGRLEVHA